MVHVNHTLVHAARPREGSPTAPRLFVPPALARRAERLGWQRCEQRARGEGRMRCDATRRDATRRGEVAWALGGAGTLRLGLGVPLSTKLLICAWASASGGSGEPVGERGRASLSTNYGTHRSQPVVFFRDVGHFLVYSPQLQRTVAEEVAGPVLADRADKQRLRHRPGGQLAAAGLRVHSEISAAFSGSILAWLARASPFRRNTTENS
jgi:hypothetical protein